MQVGRRVGVGEGWVEGLRGPLRGVGCLCGSHACKPWCRIKEIRPRPRAGKWVALAITSRNEAKIFARFALGQ